ncbi:hypothetical protein V6N12_065507 [Hibiscus sabdariffa]|uniref:RNase H type-1 domain-containing protein n=1 Tax=Hibiscus sabdariffa TaxID=183260 RepID=A0ABR2G8X1_9ROSI
MLNVDGAQDVLMGIASCGGVVCDEGGHWLIGFAKYFDSPDEVVLLFIAEGMRFSTDVASILRRDLVILGTG